MMLTNKHLETIINRRSDIPMLRRRAVEMAQELLAQRDLEEAIRTLLRDGGLPNIEQLEKLLERVATARGGF